LINFVTASKITMFLKYIKNLILKKIIRKLLLDYKPAASDEVVTTVGILIDESYFNDKEALIDQLAAHGILRENIKTLSFKERVKRKEVMDSPYFLRRDISPEGEFVKPEAAEFINEPFDLLISYYDVEKPALALATIKSKAQFKAGFATVDKRLNNFMIGGTVAEKYDEFTAELFKYLKILNKITCSH
jgi:hypothetical protein